MDQIFFQKILDSKKNYHVKQNKNLNIKTKIIFARMRMRHVTAINTSLH